jgi:hypothetical protein
MNSDTSGDLAPEGSIADDQDQEIIIDVDDPEFPMPTWAPLAIDFKALLRDDEE